MAQYLKLIIFLYSFLREMERRFFDERIPPDEFIMKELGVNLLTNSKETIFKYP